MIAEELKAIKEFNRNITWLKTREIKQKKTLITANVLVKKTGWDKESLRRKRNRKEIYFERAETGGYRYEDVTVNVSTQIPSLV